VQLTFSCSEFGDAQRAQRVYARLQEASSFDGAQG
jgi:hypothetical protein